MTDPSLPNIHGGMLLDCCDGEAQIISSALRQSRETLLGRPS